MTRLWIHLLLVPGGTAVVTYGAFRSYFTEPFTAVTLALAALTAIGWGSWRSTSDLSLRYRAACCAVSVVVAFLTSRTLAHGMAVSAVQAEVPLLLREIELRGRDRADFEVNGSRYFRRVVVNRGPEGEMIRAHFPLSSGTIVEYVVPAQLRVAESTHKCTSVIQPGWYWHSRC